MESNHKILFAGQQTIQWGLAIEFKTQDDMTPLEAAWCAFFFQASRSINALEQFSQWDLIKRHFTIQDEH